MEIKKVGVLGCGLMGSGIAQVAATARFDVTVLEVEQKFLDKGFAGIEKSLAKFAERPPEKGGITAQQKDAIRARLKGTTNKQDLAECDIVIEAIIENVEEKKKMYASLDGIVKKDAIFASNTSSISITELLTSTKRPERFIGLHFFNPVPLMKLVEVVRTIATAGEVYDTAYEFAKQLGEFQTIDDVRKAIREQIESERKHQAQHEAKEKLVGELIQRNDFEVPDSLIEQQIDIRIERGLRALAAQGLTAEQMKKMDLSRLRAGQREQAIHDVKAALLLERVAEEENVQVSDEELNQELESLARQSKQTSEAVRARLTRDGGLDRIRTRIRNEKTLDFLYDQSA